MGVTINVSTQQKQYVAGDVVDGIVNVIVDAVKSPEGSSAEELTVRLVGTATTSVPNGEKDTLGRDKKSRDWDEFLSYEVQLTSFNGKAPSGKHSFPFSMMLPPGLHSSMKEQDDSGGFCSIDYEFEACLHRPGNIHVDAVANSEIKVSSNPQETAPAVPMLAGPETQSVHYCCCFNKGSMSLGFVADRSVVRNSDLVKLTVYARNDSSSPVESMHIEVEQVSRWYACSDEGEKKRAIVSIVIPGSELGEVQQEVEEGDLRRRSAPALSDGDRQTLREMQAAIGAGTRHELLITDECLQSLKSKFVDISHTLSVKLVVASVCMDNPEVSIPLHVLGGSAVVNAPAETQSVGLSSAEANDDEGLGLVSVPQSAVKPEFSCEPPQPSAPAK